MTDSEHFFLQQTLQDEQTKNHCYRVADILVDKNADSICVTAGLLHHTFDKNNAISDEEQLTSEVKTKFGNKVLGLLEGCSKISKITAKSKNLQQAESYRKMIFALIDDIRVVIIKLADKLDRIRNVQDCTPEKQKEVAHDVLYIWAPLANRLGMGNVKDELEDLSLKIINRDAFNQIKKIVALKKDERAAYLKHAENIILREAEKIGFPVQVIGRVKHFYSIYQKMRKRNKSADELYDLLAMRILCPRVSDCYSLVGLVHTLWQPVDGRFKDYIAKPKKNGYQSLHTTVVYEGNQLEIQIRTFAMHYAAENGIASHWLYKQGTNKDVITVENVNIVTQLKELGSAWLQNKSVDDFFMRIKEELLGKSIFLFTPAGDIVELPAGSTAIDFAYSIHSAIGEKVCGAKANGQIIQLSTPVKNTQTIEIITSPHAHPTVNQLEVVKTSKARSKIRAWLNENDAVYHHKEKSEEQKQSHENVKKLASSLKQQEVTFSAKIRIGDTTNFLFSFAHCCQPKFGDNVVGYISRGRGIIVHTETCTNFWKIHNIEQRFVQVEWDEKSNPTK